MKRHRGAKAERPFPEVLFFGVIFSFAILFITSLLLCGVIMNTSNPTGSVKTVSLISLLVSGGVSGLVIAKRKGDGGVVTVLISSLIFIGLLLAVSLISSKGKVSGAVFMNGLCYMMISVFFSFFAKRRERHRRR